MVYLVRFLLYTDSTRQQATQLMADIRQDELPSFSYGSLISLGESKETAQPYQVASFPRLSTVDHPDEPGKTALLVEACIVRPEDWHENEDDDQVWIPVLKATS